LKLNGLHGIISQKMILSITTDVKTSNPTYWILFSTDDGNRIRQTGDVVVNTGVFFDEVAS
jgi:hypothetical protein